MLLKFTHSSTQQCKHTKQEIYLKDSILVLSLEAQKKQKLNAYEKNTSIQYRLKRIPISATCIKGNYENMVKRWVFYKVILMVGSCRCRWVNVYVCCNDCITVGISGVRNKHACDLPPESLEGARGEN